MQTSYMNEKVACKESLALAECVELELWEKWFIKASCCQNFNARKEQN